MKITDKQLDKVLSWFSSNESRHKCKHSKHQYFSFVTGFPGCFDSQIRAFNKRDEFVADRKTCLFCHGKTGRRLSRKTSYFNEFDVYKTCCFHIDCFYDFVQIIGRDTLEIMLALRQ